MGRLVKGIAWYLIIMMGVLGSVPRVEAGFSPSQLIPPPQSDQEPHLEKVRAFLETKMVRERLAQLGFSPQEIQSRLGQLDDEQLHQLALMIDDLEVGGNDLGIIIAVLLIAILVVILVMLLGKRIVIK